MSEFYGNHAECKEHVPYVYSQWCYCDALDGEILREGDVLDVTWKDDKTTRETISIEHSTYTVNDMGHPYDCPVSKAFTTFPIHGGTSKMRLIDHATRAVLVSRVPIPKPEPTAFEVGSASQGRCVFPRYKRGG